MKTYFAVSDIHSFQKPLKKALKEAGFDYKNKDHILIVLGDIFDRGEETLKVYNFLRSIPKKRRIMIHGNHEDLFNKLADKVEPEYHDYTNGTVATFCHIAGYNEYSLYSLHDEYYVLGTQEAGEILKEDWAKIVKTVKESNIYKWINSDEWQEYAEIGKYIFVHSWIPVVVDGKRSAYSVCNPISIQAVIKPNPDWRNASADDWFKARWFCPWAMYKAGLFKDEAKNGKVLVCGHWHASDFYNKLDNDSRETEYTCHTYFGRDIIAIDACTVCSGRVNVFKFMEE